MLVTAALIAPLTVSVLAASSSASSGPEGLPDGPPTVQVALDAADRIGPRLATAGISGLRPQEPGVGVQPGADDLPVVDIPAQALRDQQLAPEEGLTAAAGAPQPAPMAVTGNLQLLVPAPPDTEVVVGFHQAGSGSSAVAMEPLGRTVDSDVPSFEEIDEEGHDHAIMASRDRGTAFTSAVDVALPESATVLAPVDGVVTTAAPYALYGRFTDVMVAIRPTDDPDVLVHLFHLEEARVAEGDEVRAGETVVGTVRSLSMASQIDRFTGDERPHVHLEVRTR